MPAADAGPEKPAKGEYGEWDAVSRDDPVDTEDTKDFIRARIARGDRLCQRFSDEAEK